MPVVVVLEVVEGFLLKRVVVLRGKPLFLDSDGQNLKARVTGTEKPAKFLAREGEVGDVRESAQGVRREVGLVAGIEKPHVLQTFESSQRSQYPSVLVTV